jgi:glycosyltransferase involved in cell wall biosynthesis
MNIVFWQIMPSHHQSGAIRHLAEIWPGHVIAVYDIEMLESRKSLGWQHPNMGKVQCFYLDNTEKPDVFVKNIIEQQSDAIHLLGGFRGCLSTKLALRELVKRPNARLSCIAERPRLWGGFKSTILAPLWYRSFFFLYGKRFKAFFAMGELGVQCFKALGYPEDRLFPYMYQVDSVDESILSGSPKGSSVDSFTEEVRFVYVGRFDQGKGVDLILAAFDSLPGDWSLDWIGTGGELEPLVRASANGKKVRFIGSVPSDQVIKCMQSYDVCLVPSRYDGWGMMSNEALLAGLGLVVSDAVGSKDLVFASGAGKVISAGSTNALRVTLSDILDHPEQVLEWKVNAQIYRKRIAPELVGQYLFDVLRYAFIEAEGDKPVAPWLL